MRALSDGYGFLGSEGSCFALATIVRSKWKTYPQCMARGKHFVSYVIRVIGGRREYKTEIDLLRGVLSTQRFQRRKSRAKCGTAGIA